MNTRKPEKEQNSNRSKASNTSRKKQPGKKQPDKSRGKNHGAPSSQKKYPMKTTINLAMRDVPKTNSKKRLPVFLIVGLLVIVGMKFGVADLIISLQDNESMAIEAEDTLLSTRMMLADYDKVEEEYQNYNLEKLTMSESLVSTIEALGLVETYLLPSARISNFAVQGNVITVTLSSVNLDSISSIYNALKSDEKITEVRVYTASTNGDNETTTCNITIFLKSKEITEEEGGGQ